MIRAALPIWRHRWLLLLLCGWSAAWAQNDAVQTKTAIELRESPSESARKLGALPAQSPLIRLPQRQGAWVRVRTASGAEGWAHVFDLQPAAGTPTAVQQANKEGSSTGNAFRGLGSLFGGSSTTQQPSSSVATSTLGVRGLDAQDLANAQPNPEAVHKAEGFRLSERQARDFAKSATLAATPVAELAAPSRWGSGGSRSSQPQSPMGPQSETLP